MPDSIEKISFSILEFIIVSACIQSVLFTLILLARSKKVYRKQNIALSIFILIFSVAVLKGWYNGSGYYLKRPQFLFFPLYVSLGIGPAFYCYLNYLIKKDFVFKNWKLFHLALPFLQICYNLVIYFRPIEERIHHFQNEYWNILLPIEEILGILSIIFYFFLSYRELKKYQKSVDNRFTEPRKVIYKWANHFIIVVNIYIAGWIIFFFVDFFVYDYQQSYAFYYPLYMLMTIMVYWIMFKGFFTPIRIQPEQLIEDKSISYSLPQNEVKMYAEKLDQLMKNDQLFLRPKLTLTDLSEQLDLNPKYLSQIINAEKNKNFYEYVNSFRINKAKAELLSNNNKHLTISAISLECGFNSKSAFNEVFKKVTSQTPSEFIKNNS